MEVFSVNTYNVVDVLYIVVKLMTDTKHRAASLRQESYLFWMRMSDFLYWSSVENIGLVIDCLDFEKIAFLVRMLATDGQTNEQIDRTNA